MTYTKLLFSLALVLALVPSARAQTFGYINGGSSLTSFDSSTGSVISSFNTGGTGTAFAVASDDTTLYLPNIVIPGPPGGLLQTVSGKTGQLLNSVALSYPGKKVLLTSDGKTAYVLSFGGADQSSVVIVSTDTLKVTATIPIPPPSSIGDIALSPDNSALYVSVSCFSGAGACHGTKNACPLDKGICIFNTASLLLEKQISDLTGLLAISLDGQSLYVTAGSAGRLYTVNTTTLAITPHANLSGNIVGAAVVAPVGNYAVIFQKNNQFSTTAYLLNTSTNKFVKELFANAPGGAALTIEGDDEPGTPNTLAAFSPDGTSLWMLISCNAAAPPGCTTPGGSLHALAGISIPSGKLINEVAIPQDAASIAFPPPTQ